MHIGGPSNRSNLPPLPLPHAGGVTSPAEIGGIPDSLVTHARQILSDITNVLNRVKPTVKKLLMQSIEVETPSSGPAGTIAGSLPISPKLGPHTQAVVQKLRALIVESHALRSPKKSRRDSGLRKTPLLLEEKKEVLAALRDSKWNWFAMIKDKSSDKGLIRNTRRLQKEMTDELKFAIDQDGNVTTNAFSAVGSTDLTSDLDYTIKDGDQARQLSLMNEAFRSAFHKEAGIVFDTNFYTGHVALKEGFQIVNPVHQKTWVDANEVAARVKVALHFTSLYPERLPAKFDGSKFQIRYVTPMISKHIQVALKKAGVTEDSAAGQEIRTRITETETKSYKEAYLKVAERALSLETRTAKVKAKAEAEIASLTHAPESPEKKISLSLLYSKVSDPEALEMEAANSIYAEKTNVLERMTTQFKDLEDTLNGLVSTAASESDVSESEIHAWLKMPQNTIALSPEKQAILRTVQDQLDESGVAAIQMQMEGFYYANEPCFAQTTTVGVVTGLQASAGRTADEVAEIKERFPILLRPEVNTHAMEENFGELVKDRHHYHKQPGEFLTRGAKYLDRVLIFAAKSAESLQGVPDQLKLEIADFKTFNKKLLLLRKDGGMNPGDKRIKATQLVENYFSFSKRDSQDVVKMEDKLFKKAMEIVMNILAYTEK